MSTEGRSSAQVARIAWILWSAKASKGAEATPDPLPSWGKACCISAQSKRGAHFRAPSRAVVEQLSIMYEMPDPLAAGTKPADWDSDFGADYDAMKACCKDPAKCTEVKPPDIPFGILAGLLLYGQCTDADRCRYDF